MVKLFQYKTTSMLLNILVGFIFTFCSAQNERIENKIMNCSYQSFEDDGEELKELISNYQNLLITQGILKDSNGKSYRQILENIAAGNEFDKVPSTFFAIELQKIKKPDTEEIKECQKIIIADSSYNTSKLKGLEQVMTNVLNLEDIEPSIIANEILNVLSDEDFEIDFYKLRIFLLFGIIIETESGNSRKLPEIKEDETSYDLTTAFKVNIDNKSEIFVDNKKVAIEKLKKMVRAYELKNKSESIFSLKTGKKTTYKMYIDVQTVIIEEIQYLREKIAKEKYNTALDKLKDEQLNEIKKIYPLIFVE